MLCLEAIEFCNKNKLYSANTVKDFIEHLEAQNTPEPPMIDIKNIALEDPKYHISTEKRPLEVYAKVGE
jgi:hypothetical protein